MLYFIINQISAFDWEPFFSHSMTSFFKLTMHHDLFTIYASHSD